MCHMCFITHPCQKFTIIQLDGMIVLTLHTFYMFNYARLMALFSRITQVIRYQKGETYLDFTKVRDSEWQWLQ